MTSSIEQRLKAFDEGYKYFLSDNKIAMTPYTAPDLMAEWYMGYHRANISTAAQREINSVILNLKKEINQLIDNIIYEKRT